MRDWDYQVRPFSLPPGLVLMLGDVHGGSKTPGMVKKILHWREQGRHGTTDGMLSHGWLTGATGAATHLWQHLDSCNSKVEQLLRKLSDLAAFNAEFKPALEVLAPLRCDQV